MNLEHEPWLQKKQTKMSFNFRRQICCTMGAKIHPEVWRNNIFLYNCSSDSGQRWARWGASSLTVLYWTASVPLEEALLESESLKRLKMCHDIISTSQHKYKHHINN